MVIAAQADGQRTRRLATCDPGRSASMLRGSSMIFISRVFVLASALRCRLIARYSASTWAQHDRGQRRRLGNWALSVPPHAARMGASQSPPGPGHA